MSETRRKVIEEMVNKEIRCRRMIAKDKLSDAEKIRLRAQFTLTLRNMKIA